MPATAVNYNFDRRLSDSISFGRTAAPYPNFDFLDLSNPIMSRDHRISNPIEEEDEETLSSGLPQLQPQQQFQAIQNLQYQMQQQLGFQTIQQQQVDEQYESDHEEEEEDPRSPLAILRPNHPMVLQRTHSLPQIPTQRQIQQEQAQLHQYGIMAHSYSLQTSQPQYPQQQQQQQQQQQHQQLVSISQYETPPYTIPGAERHMPLHIAPSLGSMQPLQNALPLLDDMMMDLTGFLPSPQFQIDSSGSSVQSPTLPRASPSPSREGSPCSPNAKRVSFNVSPQSNSGTSASASTSVPASASASPTTPASAPESSSSAAAGAGAATTAPKRRKRVRPPTVKKPKKVKPTHFPCTVSGCDKVFSRAYNLTSHMKTHSSERPFVCEVCNLAFARRHDRERHVRLHTGEKPYSCNICGAGFMRNDALHRHQKLCGVAGSMFAAGDMYGPYDDQGYDGGEGFAFGHSSSGTGMPHSMSQ
ncbi:hypothetical protein BGX31_007812 [Mortierella sp. GBA43]|nr:hypothetical protein BGX31_007812 [Mortierella sp. GBA43]